MVDHLIDSQDSGLKLAPLLLCSVLTAEVLRIFSSHSFRFILILQGGNIPQIPLLQVKRENDGTRCCQFCNSQIPGHKDYLQKTNQVTSYDLLSVVYGGASMSKNYYLLVIWQLKPWANKLPSCEKNELRQAAIIFFMVYIWNFELGIDPQVKDWLRNLSHSIAYAPHVLQTILRVKPGWISDHHYWVPFTWK